MLAWMQSSFSNLLLSTGSSSGTSPSSRTLGAGRSKQENWGNGARLGVGMDHIKGHWNWEQSFPISMATKGIPGCDNIMISPPGDNMTILSSEELNCKTENCARSQREPTDKDQMAWNPRQADWWGQGQRGSALKVTGVIDVKAYHPVPPRRICCPATGSRVRRQLPPMSVLRVTWDSALPGVPPFLGEAHIPTTGSSRQGCNGLATLPQYGQFYRSVFLRELLPSWWSFRTAWLTLLPFLIPPFPSTGVEPNKHLAAQTPSRISFQKTQPMPGWVDCDPAKRESKRAL